MTRRSADTPSHFPARADHGPATSMRSDLAEVLRYRNIWILLVGAGGVLLAAAFLRGPVGNLFLVMHYGYTTTQAAGVATR